MNDINIVVNNVTHHFIDNSKSQKVKSAVSFSETYYPYAVYIILRSLFLTLVPGRWFDSDTPRWCIAVMLFRTWYFPIRSMTSYTTSFFFTSMGFPLKVHRYRDAFWRSWPGTWSYFGQPVMRFGAPVGDLLKRSVGPDYNEEGRLLRSTVASRNISICLLIKLFVNKLLTSNIYFR